MRLRPIFLLIAALLLSNLSPALAGAESSAPFQIAGRITGPVDQDVSIQAQASDPYFSQQWYLNRLRIPQAWDTTTGSPIVIAVIDTGADSNHPEFAGRLWVNSDETPANGIDDDHNGYVDDYNGYNFVDSNSSLIDSNSHGTSIASLIAANTNNGIGMAGINRAAKLMIVKALNHMGGGDFDDVIAGIRYAVDNGAKLINMSFGSPSNDVYLQSAIDYATANSVVVIAAAGNGSSNQVYYPSAYPSVISVGSVNSSNQLSSFSNYGSGLDFVAPGEDIVVAVPGGNYQQGAGSSFAAAEVTGVISLLLSVAPSSTPSQVTEMLKASTTYLGGGTPSSDFGYGMPNAQALLAQAVGAASSISASLSISPVSVAANGIDFATVTATITNQAGQPQVNYPITARLTGSGNIINGQPTSQPVSIGSTDSSGQVRFKVGSVVAETKQLTLTSNNNSINNGSGTLVFKNLTPPIYQMKWLGQSPYPTLKSGQSTKLWLEVQNTGNIAWLANPSSSSDFAQTKLGTDRKMDRLSNFHTPSTWVSTNRASLMQSPLVLPGGTARFEFTVTANSGAATSREYFRPVIEGVAWLNDLGIYWDIFVSDSSGSSTVSLNPYDYQATLQSQGAGLTLPRGGSGLLTLQLRNTGNAAWSNTGNSVGAGRVKLGTANPQDRASIFRSPNWLSNNRIDTGLAVAPGSTLSLSFPVTAPTQPGSYTESFRLVSEYVSWFGPVVTWTLQVN